MSFNILGYLLVKLGRKEDAINDYLKAIEIDPKLIDAFSDISIYHFPNF